MYDYWKLFIENREQIQEILSNPLFEFKQQVDKNTSQLHEYPQNAKWKNWEIFAFSPTYLVIKGSIHIFFNGGTNETDFTFTDAKAAIKSFCGLFKVNPRLARVVNLEFGVNIRPIFQASEIINQVICYKNIRPLRPYENRPGYFFIEFSVGEYYLKLYDKGKQYKGPNILRFEIKAVKNRFLQFANIHTLDDLMDRKTMKLLGVKINELFKYIVFNDDTINPKDLTKAEFKNYLRLKNPNEWASQKGYKSSTHRTREKNFKAIVQKYGKRNYYEYLLHLVKAKSFKLSVYTPKYTVAKAKQKSLNRKYNLPKSVSFINTKIKWLFADYLPAQNLKFCCSKILKSAICLRGP